MEKVKIQFECNPSEFMQEKDRKVWVDVHKQLIVIKNKRSRRKEGWIKKLVYELADAIDSEYECFNETEDNVVIDFYHFHMFGYIGASQEICCKRCMCVPEEIKKVLRKFRVKDYELIYDFKPEGNEPNKEYINIDENVIYF